MLKTLATPWTAVPPLVKQTLAALETLLDRGGARSLALVLLSVVVFWHIYVPVHELLHVAGCWISGGEVHELALKPQYGGVLLQRVFPFITAESDYAGQLTGFTTPNDFAYALVDFLPFTLSLFGAALIELCRRRRMAWLFGLAVILTFVPLTAIIGDYYEAVSLATTRLAEALIPGLPARALVSDDLFRSIGALSEAGHMSLTLGAILFLGAAMAVYLALMTLAAQLWIADRLFDRAPRAASPADAGPELPARARNTA